MIAATMNTYHFRSLTRQSLFLHLWKTSPSNKLGVLAASILWLCHLPKTFVIMTKEKRGRRKIFFLVTYKHCHVTSTAKMVVNVWKYMEYVRSYLVAWCSKIESQPRLRFLPLPHVCVVAVLYYITIVCLPFSLSHLNMSL